jgi:drug/metabolite transporter (DMT)-like permease
MALGAAVAWGVSDFLGGLFSRRMSLLAVLLVSQAVGFGTLFVLGSLQGPPAMEARSVLFAMGASASGLVGIAALYRGMAVGVVSIVAPISATGAGIPVVFGLLRGERATTLQMIGIVLALIGIVAASWSETSADSGSEPRRQRGVRWGLLAALGFGGFFIMLHEASASNVLWASAVQRLTGLGIVVSVALLLRKSVAIGWRRLPGLMVVGVLDTAANVLFAYASTSGLVSLASVLASLFPVVTVILARVVLHERLAGLQAVGVVCALAGVVLIASP